jgi:hypothetical protein
MNNIMGGNEPKNKMKEGIDGDKDNDFTDSVEYLKAVLERNDEPKKQLQPLRPMGGGGGVGHNHTIKSHMNDEQFLNRLLQPTQNVPPVAQLSSIGLVPHQLSNMPVLGGTMQLKPPVEPPYGCMKHGGVKPTYKQWQMQHNVTQRAPQIHTSPMQSMQPMQPMQPIQTPIVHPLIQPIIKPVQPVVQPVVQTPFYSAPQPNTSTPKPDERLKEISRIKQLREFMKNAKKETPTPPKLKYHKRNKPIRANINKKKIEIKQPSMEDIRRYLVKHGFIRVGSIAPNDVLKQMYESLQLMNADIKNHNPENMLYNYFNDKNT